ncbi:MAG: Pvc16 family protein [Nitrolancea sp.]
MLADIHESLANLLYQRGQLPASEIDVRFETPTREWIERLTRPTVDFFLFKLEENVDLRQTSFNNTRTNGQSERKLAPRRINLHYLVCSLATDERDQHEILWRVLAILMRYREIPAEIVAPSLQQVEPALSGQIPEGEPSSMLDLWSGLGAVPHPAIHYVVTAPLDLNIAIQAPLVLTRTARYLRMHDPALATEIASQIGGIVRAKDGLPVPGARVTLEGSASEGVVTGTDGSFVLSDVSQGMIQVRVVPPKGKELVASFEVPADSYDIVLK